MGKKMVLFSCTEGRLLRDCGIELESEGATVQKALPAWRTACNVEQSICKCEVDICIGRILNNKHVRILISPFCTYSIHICVYKLYPVKQAKK